MSLGYNKAMDNSHKAGSMRLNSGLLGLTLRAKILGGFWGGGWSLLPSAINLFKLSLLHPNSWSLDKLKRKKGKKRKVNRCGLTPSRHRSNLQGYLALCAASGRRKTQFQQRNFLPGWRPHPPQQLMAGKHLDSQLYP